MAEDRQSKAMRIVVGIMLMTAFVLIVLGLLTRYAGVWGVPFFSYTTERGSTCTNTLTGYRCDALTTADVAFYSDLALPAGTTVSSASYHATHDYQLSALLLVPKRQAANGLRVLNEEFGPCVDHPAPISTRGLQNFCTMANGDAVTQSGEPPSRLYVVGTGVRRDGARVISLSVRSR